MRILRNINRLEKRPGTLLLRQMPQLRPATQNPKPNPTRTHRTQPMGTPNRKQNATHHRRHTRKLNKPRHLDNPHRSHQIKSRRRPRLRPQRRRHQLHRPRPRNNQRHHRRTRNRIHPSSQTVLHRNITIRRRHPRMDHNPATRTQHLHTRQRPQSRMVQNRALPHHHRQPHHHLTCTGYFRTRRSKPTSNPNPTTTRSTHKNAAHERLQTPRPEHSNTAGGYEP